MKKIDWAEEIDACLRGQQSRKTLAEKAVNVFHALLNEKDLLLDDLPLYALLSRLTGAEDFETEELENYANWWRKKVISDSILMRLPQFHQTNALLAAERALQCLRAGIAVDDSFVEVFCAERRTVSTVGEWLEAQILRTFRENLILWPNGEAEVNHILWLSEKDSEEILGRLIDGLSRELECCLYGRPFRLSFRAEGEKRQISVLPL